MIRKTGLLLSFLFIAFAFSSCEKSPPPDQEKSLPAPQENTSGTPQTGPDHSKPEEQKNKESISSEKKDEASLTGKTPPLQNTKTLDWVLKGSWRGQDSLRDPWRHPGDVLNFFAVEPHMNIIEIWPGGGWYSAILAPWIHKNGGVFTAAIFAPEPSDTLRQDLNTQYHKRFSDKALYGDIRITALGPKTESIAPKGSTDIILSFRNVHNWMADGYAQKAFHDFYKALKPGGILGIVEHRLPDSRGHDPKAHSGYVQEAYIKKLAQDAGFEFLQSSEVNANPKDSADHPFGVWTLPPVKRTSPFGQKPDPGFDRTPYDAIGESDRMTLKFQKPVTGKKASKTQ